MSDEMKEEDDKSARLHSGGILVRALWLVLFLASASTAWFFTYQHHATLGLGVVIIVVPVSVSVYSLYKASEGKEIIVSAAAGIVVLTLSLGQIQKTPAPPKPLGRDKILVERWASCPNDHNPMAGRMPAHPETASPDLQAHIDSVIAPDGSANVYSQELVCVSTLTSPAPDRSLWLISRIEPTPVPPQKPYKLFFALAEISNPQPGRYSVRYSRGCSSSAKGSVHTLMIVSVTLRQSRKLWQNYNENHTGNCFQGTTFDIHRRRLVGTVVSNQLSVTEK